MNDSAIFRPQTLLAAAIGAALLFGAVAPAEAQRSTSRQAQREAGKSPAAAVAQYPEATRKQPPAKSARATRKMQQMIELYDEDKLQEARALAEEILATETANAYERAFSAQFAAQVALAQDDTAASIAHLKRAIELEGLDNNGHFSAMWMLAQLQVQEEQYPQAVATIDRLMAETNTQSYEHLLLKGRALNRAENYPEAVAALKQAAAIAPQGKSEWQSELMYAYAESDQGAEAARLAEQIAAQAPSDKRAQMNLAATYLQTDAYDKAAAVLEKLRASGQLTDDREYRQLYSTYLNIDGKEREAANVIAEGLQKGILQPNHDTYVVLAQAYYFSDQVAPAIDAYRKAAPLAKDGETYLNLAKVLWQEDRITEAKAAAREAMSKGLKNPDDANKILAIPGG